MLVEFLVHTSAKMVLFKDLPSMNEKSRKRKLSVCTAQLKYRGRRRRINVFNLFQSEQFKALKEKDPSFKRTDLTPKERALRQAELRTKITEMWRELPSAEKDKVSTLSFFAAVDVLCLIKLVLLYIISSPVPRDG